jgi:hypothetical protein
MEPGELAESRVALKAYSWVPVFFQFLNPAMEELAQHFLRLLQCARRHPVMSSGLSLQTVAAEIEVFRRRSDRKERSQRSTKWLMTKRSLLISCILRMDLT